MRVNGEDIAGWNAIAHRMQTEWIDLDVTGEKMPAFVARPDGAARGGLIVIEEIFGVNADIQNLTKLAASDGYLAVAPNIYHRTDPYFDAAHDDAGFAKGLAAAAAIDLAQIVADLTAAADYLRAALGPEANIATWGFCFGGSIAYYSATLPFVSAAVSFYGSQIARSSVATRPPFVAVTPQIRAPLFLAFGGKDASITPDDVAAIREALAENGKSHDLQVYAEEDHAFFRHGPGASPSAADVWQRVRAFLAANLARA